METKNPNNTNTVNKRTTRSQNYKSNQVKRNKSTTTKKPSNNINQPKVVKPKTNINNIDNKIKKTTKVEKTVSREDIPKLKLLKTEKETIIVKNKENKQNNKIIGLQPVNKKRSNTKEPKVILKEDDIRLKDKPKLDCSKNIIKIKDIEEEIEKEFKDLQPVNKKRKTLKEDLSIISIKKEEKNITENKSLIEEKSIVKEEKTKKEDEPKEENISTFTREFNVEKKLLEEIDKEIEQQYKHIKPKEEKENNKPDSKIEQPRPKKKKRKLKVYNLFCIILMLITLIASIVLVTNVNKLGILPTKYFLLVIAAMLIINLFVFLLISRKFKLFRFIGILLSILLITISSVGSSYIAETNEFLSKNFNNIKVEISSYKVLTLKDSNLKTEQNLKGKKVGYLFETIKELNKFKSNNNCELIEYRDLYSLYEDLLNKKIDAILVDDAFIGILEEDYPDIETKTKYIYTYNVETPIEETEEEKLSKEETEPEKIVRPINVYISGSDSRSKNLSVNSKSDVNMIVSINPFTHEILLTSIPRDYYVQPYGKTGLKDKLTHVGIYGLTASTKTVEELFGIEIDYSVKVGMNAVVEVVDLVGGIEVYSDISFHSFHYPGWTVKQGMNKLNGKKALAYARERYAYASGDRHRIRNQQQVLEAVLKKAMTDKSLLLKYDKLLESLGKFYKTDIPGEVIKEFMQEQLNDMPTWTFTTQAVDGYGEYRTTYTTPNNKRYVMIPNEADVKKASIAIKSINTRK